MTASNVGPLAGIRILEVGTMLAGPYATMLLADLGAEVTKIEPAGGEISRSVGATYFASLNRNKSSIILDLNSDAGQQRLGELVGQAHALLVNLKPSAIRRLGLNYDKLRRHNERIVCVAITGFGLYGGDDPAFDYVVQAGVGTAALTGDPDGPPTLPGYSSADNSTGMTAALGLLAKIISGTGGQVDVSLRDVMLSQLNYHASAYLNSGVEPQRRPYGAHSYYVPAQLFPTAEGIWRCSSPTTASGSRLPPKRASGASKRWPSESRAATKSWRWLQRCWQPTAPPGGSDDCARWVFRQRPSGPCPKRSRRHRKWL